MQWNLVNSETPPQWFIQAVKTLINRPSSGSYAAQLLWQRGIRDSQQLTTFTSLEAYEPANPGEFGQEMHLAMARLQTAYQRREKIAIWGDFDADGITATAVLWDGLGQFFPKHTHLVYHIPHRLRESHGLNIAGIDALQTQGCTLIVTCDTGSTNISEINHANQLGIDVIVTDHHTLPAVRPPVTAIINPRHLSPQHPLFHLSGVAVAYKLVEALYQTLPDIPQHPVTDLLDLVAIGLIADLVQLTGDCRYLAQLGLQRLHQDYDQKLLAQRRPGLGKLLELCQGSGDRPTDISFGIGPRINAVSRIYGDATFCVELLTSQDIKHCHQLAEKTEIANIRRKSLQKEVETLALQKLSRLDLSTLSVIVLEDTQWPTGVLGLVAGKVAQETGRPTVLLNTENYLARGSARSINGIDLYQLVKCQEHLLHSFGGHPFAAGLSLPVQNIPLFTDAINQQLRQSLGVTTLNPSLQVDLTITVAELTKELFWELKLLEPYGIGNPTPRLLIQNCWFKQISETKPRDIKHQKVNYMKTCFHIWDDSTDKGFPGIWWGHKKEELPTSKCDCLVELDYNSYKKRYEIRLIDVNSKHTSQKQLTSTNLQEIILDWRHQEQTLLSHTSPLLLKDCPTSWDNLRSQLRQHLQNPHNQSPVAIAWHAPQPPEAREIWLTLVGMAKYISRTNQTVPTTKLLTQLAIEESTLSLGIKALESVGFQVTLKNTEIQITGQPSPNSPTSAPAQREQIERFLAAIVEAQFQQNYFAHVPVSTIYAMIT